MHAARRIAAAFVLITAPPIAASAADAPAEGKVSVATLLEGTVLEGRERDILAGKKVTVEALQSSRREMSAALACLIPPGRVGSLAHLHNAEAIMPDQYSDASGPIDVNDLEGSLASLTIGKGAEKEAKRYLGATPGWELSLSSEEIAAFNALDPPEGQEVPAVEAELARQFAKRVRDYQARGLEGIAPFDRGDGETSSSGDDLRNSTISSEGFLKVLPNTHRALLAFPLGDQSDGESYYFWTRIRVLGRPVFLLNQRLIAQPDGVPVVIERQFYATQFLGAGQTVTALVPVEEGTLALYVNRSFVDRWTGPSFSVGTKRAVGLKIINGILPEMADEHGLCEGIAAP
jgi:hypothetical protein